MVDEELRCLDQEGAEIPLCEDGCEVGDDEERREWASCHPPAAEEVLQGLEGCPAWPSFCQQGCLRGDFAGYSYYHEYARTH